ncbi:MAG: DUF3365 domain-containing protein [Cyclobacteriaceae bacterium]|nr:DUF3365 domain-containing protein [Cyclobacteriaceae bacterium]UYN86076.1 MAG: DUF3365 domain-containing protein [Cyclobacteriaceae bacterium]
MRLALVYSVLFFFFTLLSCHQTQQEKGTSGMQADSVYLKKGDQLVAATFDTLRNSLLAAIGEQGFAYAIQFCNEKAYTLTETYAIDGVRIKRVSMQYRNPSNQPDSLELAVLETFQTEGPRTQLIYTPGEVHYVKPISMQAMCLNCHGLPNVHIKPETLHAIQTNYPADKATGYAEGDLRGIWHIIFPANPR